MCLCMGLCSGMQCLQRTKMYISPLELEFQVIVSCPLWVLGTELHLLKEQKVFLSTEPPQKKKEICTKPFAGNKCRFSETKFSDSFLYMCEFNGNFYT